MIAIEADLRVLCVNNLLSSASSTFSVRKPLQLVSKDKRGDLPLQKIEL